jgi:hypothetical protein
LHDFLIGSPEREIDISKCSLISDNGLELVILVTDSVGCHARIVLPDNGYAAAFDRQGNINPTKYPQTNLTALTKDLPYVLGTFGLSGLGAVYGEHMTPSALVAEIRRALGLPENRKPRLVTFRLGTNDIKSYFVPGNGDEWSASDVDDDEAGSTHELARKIERFGEEFSIAWDGAAVAWIGAGCTAYEPPTDGKGTVMQYQHSPRGQRDPHKPTFDLYLTSLVGHIEFHGNDVFRPVMRDGKECGKFIVFAAANSINESSSGTGHPSNRDLANFMANMINTIGILLVKLTGNKKLGNRIIQRAGLPARWKVDLEIEPHSLLVMMPFATAEAKDMTTLRRQRDWPESVCKTIEFCPRIEKKRFNFEHSSSLPDVIPGQFVRVKKSRDAPDSSGFGAIVMSRDAKNRKFLILGVVDGLVREVEFGQVLVASYWIKRLYSDQVELFRKQAKEASLEAERRKANVLFDRGPRGRGRGGHR